MKFTTILLYASFGLLGGFLAGLLGVGGGIVFIPLFDHIFSKIGIDNEELVRLILANSFLCILFSGIVSSITQKKLGNFHLRPILYIAFPAMISGALVSRMISGFDWYSDEMFKLFFVILLGLTLWRSWMKRNEQKGDDDHFVHPLRFVLIGVVTGLVSAMSGLGGGVAMIPLLHIFAGYSMKRSSAISIGVIPIMVIPFLVVYMNAEPSVVLSGWSLGYLHFSSVLPIVVGIFIGSPLGVRIAQRSKNSHLQLIFAILIAILIVKYSIPLIMR